MEQRAGDPPASNIYYHCIAPLFAAGATKVGSEWPCHNNNHIETTINISMISFYTISSVILLCAVQTPDPVGGVSCMVEVQLRPVYTR